MEFLDEDARPRFVLQSKQLSNSDPITHTRSLNRPGTFISISLSIFFFVLSFLYFTFEPFNSLFIWLSLSFFIGPFAPLSITGGNIRVGLGSPIQDPDKINDGSDPEHDFKKPNKRSNRPVKRVVEFAQVGKVDGPVCNLERVEGSVCNLGKVEGSVCNLGKVEEWSDGDVELLRKMMGKNPVGKPGRWEAITDGFKGRFSVENVIKKAKELGEKKISDGDSYQKFLKDRKVSDKRAESGNEGDFDNVDVKKVVENSWSSGEDLALLNALKTFPKDVAMRWEKIAAAVPGKNKAACMKRMAELKKDFRSSKSANVDA